MLSGFIFSIDLIYKLFELVRRAVVTMSKSWYLILSYYSLILIGTQSYLVDGLSEHLMPDYIHFPHLLVSAG